MNNNLGLLTKKQYLEINASAFVNLSNPQKNEKYIKYREKHLAKNKSEQISMNSKNMQIVPFKNTTSNINLKNRNMNNNNKLLTNNSNNSVKFKLSKCLLSYARASIDPFDNITELPCIPDVITVPAYRFRTYLEADVQVGVLGVGFAVMSPWKMIMNGNGSVPGVTDFPVVTTTNFYGLPYYAWDSATLTAGAVRGWNPQSQLDLGAITVPGFNWRLVAAGMELDYTGVLLDQAGLVTVLQWDALENIPQLGTGTSIGVLRQHPRSQTCATSREARCYVRYEPTSADNFTYHNEPFYYPPARDYYYPMGIFVSGATPNTTFRVRAVAFFEVQSSTLPAVPSEADPIGFPAFQAARSSHLPTPDPQSDLWSILKKTASNILTSISGFAPVIGGAIGSLFGQPAVGAAVGGVSKDLIQSIFG